MREKHTMKTIWSKGFTLIELLTVVAIIAILAALTATTLPRVLERAKIADVESDFSALKTALATYYSDHGSYPPALEYTMRTPNSGTYTSTTDYLEALNLANVPELKDKFGVEDTAYVYIPVYKDQFTKVEKFYARQNDPYAKRSLDPLSLTPPPGFDAYVLIGLGPVGSASKTALGELDYFGVTPQPLPGEAPEVTGLRAYYLATRDANKNGLLDFDFRARTRQGEGKPGAYPTNETLLFHLPKEVDDSLNPTTGTGTGPGPMIFKLAG